MPGSSLICRSYSNDAVGYYWLPLVIYSKKELASFQTETKESREGLVVNDCF